MSFAIITLAALATLGQSPQSLDLRSPAPTVSPVYVMQQQSQPLAQSGERSDCVWTFRPPRLILPKLQRQREVVQEIRYTLPAPTPAPVVYVPTVYQQSAVVPVATPAPLTVPTKQSLTLPPLPQKGGCENGSCPPAPGSAGAGVDGRSEDSPNTEVLKELKRLSTTLDDRFRSIEIRLTKLENEQRAGGSDTVPPPPVIPDSPPGDQRANTSTAPTKTRKS